MVTLKKCKKVSKNLTLFTFRAQITTIQRILSTSTSHQAAKPLILIDADAIRLYCIPFISRKDAKPLSFFKLMARKRLAIHADAPKKEVVIVVIQVVTVV